MKKRICLMRYLGLIALCMLAVLAPLSGQAAVPGQISFQGYLTDSDGTALPDGTYTMIFYLFNAEIGGSQLWNAPNGEVQEVAVTNGIYQVQLGAVQPLDSSVFDGGAAWLEVVIEGEILSPRQLVTASAYALKAGDADTLAGNSTAALDARYVNEGQANVITSAMIADNAVTAQDLGDNSVGSAEISSGGVGTSEVADNSLTAADLAPDSVGNSELAPNSVGSAEVIDNSLTAGDLAADSVGASEIATGAVASSEVLDNSLTAADLASNSVTADEIGAGAVGTSEIADSSITAADLAADSVGYSEIATNAVREDEIRWSLNHTAADLNGGIMSLTNSSAATSGNYPMGVAGQITGDPTSNPVIGVFGGAPGLGQGAPMGSFPDTKIGVGGASDTGHGVVGVSTSGRGVYGYSDSSYGVYANSANSYAIYAYSPNSYAIYGYGNTRGVYGYCTGVYGSAIYGYASASADNGYGGYFYSADTNGTGIYAQGGTGGYAADFRGIVRIRDRSTGDTVMELGSGLDYAEGFDVSDSAKPEPGSVLIIDPDNPGHLKISTTAYDTKVAGIVAGAGGLGSGVRLGADVFDNDVALAGRVFCKVETSAAAVKTGDLLTTSDIAGYAMKVGDHARAQGAILGKAMQDLQRGEKGTILVLVTLQ
jgi:hypothetical protein